MKGNVYCYFHDSIYNRPYAAELPPLEDANSIQVGIMYVLQRLQAGTLDAKTANTMLYALQTASMNLRHADYVNFEPNGDELAHSQRAMYRKPPRAQTSSAPASVEVGK